MSSKIIIGLDQGTSSTRAIAFRCSNSEVLFEHRVSVNSIFPQEGWVEMDPLEILESTLTCLNVVSDHITKIEESHKVYGIGISNQRETTIVWNKETGRPLYNAIVWLDSRTKETVHKLLNEKRVDQNELLFKCGLPISTYFSALKLKWLLNNILPVKESLDKNQLLFGTVDTWLIWNLTKGVHITDVTNASRTMLMNISSLSWDEDLLSFFEIPKSILPCIKSSSEIYGYVKHRSSLLFGVPIAGCLGDQQAALLGQGCIETGMAKNTYGTGCFMLYNVGSRPVFSNSGLLTTVAYQLGPNNNPIYALEGSIAIAGAAMTWLKNNMNLINSEDEIESMISSVDNTGGVYFVPAFSGLFAPHWRPDARGTIVGLTQFSRKAHLIRATAEAVCFQTREILEAMERDCSHPLTKLLVDGGMSNNNAIMKIQANLLGIDVYRIYMSETSALGAAIAAGKAIGVWENILLSKHATFKPSMTATERNDNFILWKRAVQKSLNS